jgi:hypothetical protein
VDGFRGRVLARPPITAVAAGRGAPGVSVEAPWGAAGHREGSCPHLWDDRLHDHSWTGGSLPTEADEQRAVLVTPGIRRPYARCHECTFANV